jgi:sterol desaturase/sphingolipid hydroxylase (fatty acid hydroxylase superfamily)
MMFLDSLILILQKIGAAYARQVPIIIGLAILFAAATLLKDQASSPGKVWWRNPGLATDVTYALLHGLAAPYFKLPALIVVYVVLSGTFMTPPEVADFFAHGGGPLSVLPFWAQVIVHLILADLLLYWIHRIFHGHSMWRFHAIHHSSEEVDWTTSYRFHPINLMLQPALVTVVMLTLGISPAVMAFLVPFDVLSSAWVHANLNWTLGPLKYVVATPVFHRWHHTLPDQGGDSNFAPTFSFWDWVFGTFYMPEGKLPETFGTDDALFPEGYLRQLVYPFKPKDGVLPITAVKQAE